MTIGELKEKIKDINDNVVIYPLINTIDGEDSLYDVSANIELLSCDTANDNGWIEILTTLKKQD